MCRQYVCVDECLWMTGFDGDPIKQKLSMSYWRYIIRKFSITPPTYSSNLPPTRLSPTPFWFVSKIEGTTTWNTLDQFRWTRVCREREGPTDQFTLLRNWHRRFAKEVELCHSIFGRLLFRDYKQIRCLNLNLKVMRQWSVIFWLTFIVQFAGLLMT